MNTNIFKHEFRTRLRSVIIWGLSMAAMVFFFTSIYPTFAAEATNLKALLDKFPPQLLQAFGMNRMDLSSVLGFYGFVFTFAQLCLSIQAGNYGFGLVSIEESELTADFLLTKPVSRISVLTSKLLASFSSLLATDLIFWVASCTALLAFHGEHPIEWPQVIGLMSSMVLFQVFFLAVGLVISLLVKRVRSVTPWSMGLGFGTYVLSAFSGLLGDVKLEYITPFKHLDPAYFASHGSFDPALLGLNIGISVISVAVSYWLYNRRDIAGIS
jgi:ABC-2 type transport system permease protein